MTSIQQYNEHWWTEISKKVKKAIVFLDDIAADCLHWHGGMVKLINAGASSIKELSSFEKGDENAKKAVFIVGKPIIGLVSDIVSEIVRNSKFEYCILITNASPMLHKMAKYPGREIDNKTVFVELEENVLHLMGNLNYTCEIFHFPFHSITIANKVFLTPPFNKMLPLLQIDIQNADELLKSRNNQSKDQSLSVMMNEGGLNFSLLPYELQIAISHFISSFHSMFQMLNMKEDIFTVGSFSRVLGEQLESFQPAKQRRKTATNKVSLILIDRTLDMTGVTNGKLTTLLDKIFAHLPNLTEHTDDVEIDMAPLFGLDSVHTEEDIFPPGCLANETNNLEKMIFEDESKIINDLVKELQNATEESDEKENQSCSELNEAIEMFKYDEKKIKENLLVLQQARAIQLACNGTTQTFRQIRETAVKFHKTSAKKQDPKGFLVYATKMIRSRKERGLSLDDLLLIILHLYTLIPVDEEFYPEDEDRIQSALSEAIVEDKDNLSPVVKKMTKDEEVDELMAFRIVKLIFQKFNGVTKARRELKNFRSLINDGVYKSFIEKLLEDIFADDRRDIVDLEHRSGGLGNLIKSGIGFLGVNVSKMHPRENPNIWIYVVGGITGGEIQTIINYVKSKSQCEIMVGSNRLISPYKTLDILLNENSLICD